MRKFLGQAISVDLWRWLAGTSLVVAVIRGLNTVGTYDLLLTAAQFGSLALAVAFLCIRSINRRRLTWTHYLAVSFGIFAAVSAIWSPIPATTLSRSLLFLLILLFAVVTAHLRWADKNIMDRDLLLLFWFAVAVSAVGLLLGVFQVPGMWGPYDRFKGLTVNATVGAWMAALVFPIGYSRVLDAKGRIRVGLIVGMATLGVAIVLSGTRGALVALVGTVFLIHLLRMKSWIVGVSIAGVVVALFLAGASGLFAFGRIAEPTSDISSGRFGLWGEGLTLWSHRPIGGWGFGSTSTLSGFTNQDGMSLHNAYLSVLIETGIVGSVIFVALLLSLFMRRGLRMNPGIVAAAGAVLVNAAFESSLVNLGSPITVESWLLLAALLAVGSAARSESESGVESPAGLLSEAGRGVK